MAKSKKQNVSARVRAYQAKHPTASAKQVAEACGTSSAYVYVVRANNPKWKTVSVGTSNQSIVKHLGATMAKDDVTKLTDEQTSRLVYNMTKARARMQALPSMPSLGDTVGGLTLTRKEQDGSYVYRWVKEDLVKSGEVAVDAPPQVDNVNQPAHYKVGGIETIDFIEAKQLNYHLGNVVKYIARADNKGNRKEDLLKAQWYLGREIEKFTSKDAA